MLKKWIFTLFLLMLSVTASADWWDCESSVDKHGLFGWGYAESVTREVKAEKRSSAQYKAVEGGTFFLPGFVGSYKYICSMGATEENGKSCKYRFSGTTVDCKRQ